MSELAWAAGLFDGEGSFSLSKGYPRAQVQMTEEQPVRRFIEAVGMGKVYGPYAYKRGKPVWNYAVQGRAKVGPLLELLRPWLSDFRIAQAERVLG